VVMKAATAQSATWASKISWFCRILTCSINQLIFSRLLRLLLQLQHVSRI
jgi:hypothetical protein